MAKPKWTPVMDALLLKLAAKGAPTREIADMLRWRFGIIVSKNAVIGRAHRLAGYKRYRRNEQRICFKPRERGPDRKPRKKYPQKRKERIMVEIPKQEPKQSGLRLWQLEPHQCKWPYGEREFTFCGAPRNGREPYCAYHANMSWSNGYRAELAAKSQDTP